MHENDVLTKLDMLNQTTVELYEQGQIQQAFAIARQKLQLAQTYLGPNNLRTVASLDNLGEMLQSMGELAEARTYFERSLAITEMVLGPEHPHTAVRLNNLGNLLHEMDELAGALPCHERLDDLGEGAWPRASRYCHQPQQPGFIAAKHG